MSSQYLEQIQNVLRETASGRGDSYSSGRLVSTTVDVAGDSPARVRELVEAFDADDGWVQVASENVAYARGDVLAGGVILCAELAKGDRSLHVRQSVEGWRVTTIERVAAEVDGELVERVEQLGRAPFEVLAYQVGWKLERQHCDAFETLVPYASRFVGGTK